MGWKSPLTLAGIALSVALAGSAARAQCAANNYVHNGAPASQRDCQPMASLKLLNPSEMSASDADLVTSRRTEIQQALRFYGADLDASGWEYRQAVSPLLHRHILLIYTNTAVTHRASRLVVIVSSQPDEKVQAIPSFQHGLNPYLPGWQSKGSFSIYNRLIRSEQGDVPLSFRSAWIDHALLYLTIAGREPSVPTQTDSVDATWDLAMKSASTPVLLEKLNGQAEITLSDLSTGKRTVDWKLTFSRTGQILKAEKSEHAPQKHRTMQTIDETNYALNTDSAHRSTHTQ